MTRHIVRKSTGGYISTGLKDAMSATGVGWRELMGAGGEVVNGVRELEIHWSRAYSSVNGSDRRGIDCAPQSS